MDETKGQVLTYNKELVNTSIFSTSSGMTENAIDVFSGDIPYLIKRKQGRRNSPKIQEEFSFNINEFVNKINENIQSCFRCK